jgi:hypothetical protein
MRKMLDFWQHWGPRLAWLAVMASIPAATLAQDAKPETRITPKQAQDLFRSVDTILHFDSSDTGYAIHHAVQPRLVTRGEVEDFLAKQFKEDKSAQRLKRSELVLKKFALLDRDFQLEPFLLQLLREQIAGYYDDKTKTVNLLDWVNPETQRPVLAHELTHALQDQHVDLQKWEDQDKDGTPKNATQDNTALAVDEDDTVRDAVAEGQAMVVFADYALAPQGKTLLTDPDAATAMEQAMGDYSDSPVMARAPLFLQESLIFPYQSGMKFIATVLRFHGQHAAFNGTLDHPPASTYEILNPQAYMRHDAVPLLTMPDIHGLIGKEYKPYDIGVMGELDVRMLGDLFGGPYEGRELAKAWAGGLYYAAQSRSVKNDAEKASTASLGLLYLSRWTTPQAAQRFASIYAAELARKYDRASARALQDAPAGTPGNTRVQERVWDTSEGVVLIAVAGKTAFVSESFPLPLAHKLEFVMMGSIAGSTGSEVAVGQPHEELSAPFRYLALQYGLFRCAVHMPKPRMSGYTETGFSAQ